MTTECERNNRKAEFLIRTVKYLSTLATVAADALPEYKGKKKFKYPKKEIDFMWEGVLLCQFHDCLGSAGADRLYPAAPWDWCVASCIRHTQW